MEIENLKPAVSSIGGATAAFFEPVFPVAALCTAMVAVDIVSAIRLNRRLRKAGKPGTGSLSALIGRSAFSLTGIYTALTLAHCAQHVLGTALYRVTGGLDALNAVGTAIFLWLAMSILEKESTCTTSTWADRLRRHLSDRLR